MTDIPVVSLIVAMARNRVIGVDNTLPWRLSADLQHFKALTMGKPIIMGRLTWESIGRPLPGRRNIVLSRSVIEVPDGVDVVNSLADAIELCSSVPEIMIMGGAQVYKQALPLAQQLYITEVACDVEGDAWFPEIDQNAWRELTRESHVADEKNEYAFDFVCLERV